MRLEGYCGILLIKALGQCIFNPIFLSFLCCNTDASMSIFYVDKCTPRRSVLPLKRKSCVKWFKLTAPFGCPIQRTEKLSGLAGVGMASSISSWTQCTSKSLFPSRDPSCTHGFRGPEDSSTAVSLHTLTHAPQEGLLVVRPPGPAFPILVSESDLRSPFPMSLRPSGPPPRRRPRGRHFAPPGS